MQQSLHLRTTKPLSPLRFQDSAIALHVGMCQCLLWVVVSFQISSEGADRIDSTLCQLGTLCLLGAYLKVHSNFSTSCAAALADDGFQGTQRTKHLLPGTPFLQSIILLL